MDKLIMETKVTNFVCYSNLGEFCRKVWDYPKRVDAMMESDNDTDYEINVEKKPLDEYQTKELADIKRIGGFENWRAHTVMQDLANNGYILEGCYVVRVSW